MRIGFGQIIIVAIVIFLLFGDLESTKKRLSPIVKQINNFFQKKNRKKGT
uniref:Sec-independent protein translocase component tatA n=1 Tax=Nitzschia sp. PL1-4 TaxID=2083272 RepID=A0A2Z5ZB75_9STRA|nr:Sec-independent protein translocase component tatA [Nitzschia sp. PL1-4]